MKKKDIRMILITFVIGGIVLGPASYFKTRADIEARLVTFNKNISAQYGATKGNVQETIDEIYDLAMAKQAANSPRYADGEIVYFNPVANTKCTSSDYSTSNSATNYKGNGCMRWFAYLDDGGNTVKLLLDHNTTALVQWYTEDIYVEYPNSRAKQEIDNLISTSGSNWKVSSSDDTIAIKSIGFIDAKDIAKITGKTNSTATWDWRNSDNGFLFDSNTNVIPAAYGKYWWLSDRINSCTTYGCVTADSTSYTNVSSNTQNMKINGYWTSTNVGTSGSYVWCVLGVYSRIQYDGATGTSEGVRPVITILRSKL